MMGLFFHFQMASNMINCRVCERRHVTKPSTDWCPECNCGYCTECKQIHDISPISENHVTVHLSLSIVSGIVEPFTEIKCELHDDKYQLFCQFHDEMLCLTCLAVHSSCKDVVPLNTVVAGIKESELFRDAETGLSDTKGNMTEIIKVLYEYHDSINVDTDQMKAEVDTLCDQIINRVREAQSKTKAEIEKRSEGVRSAMLEISDDLKEKKEKVSILQTKFNTAKTYGSEVQMYIVFREIMAKNQMNDDHIRKLLEGRKTDKVKLTFSAGAEVDRFLNLENLGIINETNIPTDLKMKTSKEKQAQIVQPRIQSRSFDDIKLSRGSSFKYKCSHLTCCTVLPDGKILICNYGTLTPERNFIAVVDEAGKLVSTIPVPGKYVFDVAVIDQNTIAVTSGSDNTVCMVDIPLSSIKKSIATDDWCYGITYYDQHIYYCVGKHGIFKASISTGKSSVFVRTNLSFYLYITNYNNKLYFTDYNQHTVTCVDMEGRQIWNFKNPSVLKDPWGINVDGNGYIYIANRNGNSVIMLSEDGKKSRQILTKDDGLNEPTTVRYDNVRHRLLVGNRNGEVLVYKFD